MHFSFLCWFLVFSKWMSEALLSLDHGASETASNLTVHYYICALLRSLCLWLHSMGVSIGLTFLIIQLPFFVCYRYLQLIGLHLFSAFLSISKLMDIMLTLRIQAAPCPHVGHSKNWYQFVGGRGFLDLWLDEYTDSLVRKFPSLLQSFIFLICARNWVSQFPK